MKEVIQSLLNPAVLIVLLVIAYRLVLYWERKAARKQHEETELDITEEFYHKK